MRRLQIQEAVESTDVLSDFDIKDAVKKAKVGWLKALIIAAVWPLIKKELLKHLNARIVLLIEDVINGI